MSQDGDSIWTSLLTMNETAKGFDLQLADDGGYIVTGRTFADGKDMPFLIKTNASGMLQPLASKKINQPDDIVVFPNPASDKVIFEFNDNTYGSIIITDLSGHKCADFEVSGLRAVFNTTQLEPGVYFFTLKTSSSISTGKLLINH